MDENRISADCWVVKEAGHVHGTDVVTCLLADGSLPLRVRDEVIRIPQQSAPLVVEDIIIDCFLFERLEPQTQGHVVLRGSEAATVKTGDILTLATR